ncbi:Hypothetical protein CINCED_3A010995 [Cinara cedri]|uniref:Uncharacterized protein n=1 Tax=Cinara cedri TaxID=506608 RepID=A0A5E4NFH7_9HEMI|nr:Hypothetical protein CINCED_3A010995 [Cinara cedri]
MTTDIAELKFKAHQLILSLEPTSGEGYDKNRVNIKFDVLHKLSDIKHNLTFNDLLNLTNLTSKTEKKIFKKKKLANDKKALEDFIDYLNRKYLKHTRIGCFGDGCESEIKQIQKTRFETQIILQELSNLKHTVKRHKIIYRNEARGFKHHTNSWSLWNRDQNDQLKNIEENLNTITSKIKVANRVLEEHVYDYYDLEKRRHDKLYKEFPIYEACYKLLTWLSPMEWKKKFNVNNDKLEYDIRHLDADTDEGRDSFSNINYHKSFEELSKDMQLEPVHKMYWKSAEHVIKKINSLETRINNQRVVSEIINNTHTKKKNTTDKSVNKHKSGITTTAPISCFEQTHSKHIKLNSNNDILTRHIENIKTILSSFFKEHGIRDTHTGIELLITKLNEAIAECEKIPKDRFKETEIIMKIIERNDEKLDRLKMLERNKIKAAQRAVDKMKELTRIDVRKQKLLPYRRSVPRQKRPKTPKKPKLNNDQLMYLKCFTIMLPEDIPEHAITVVPEFKI